MKFARAAPAGLLAALIAAAPASASTIRSAKAKPRVHRDCGSIGARLHAIAERTGRESADDTLSRLKRALSLASDDFSRNFKRVADRLRDALSPRK